MGLINFKIGGVNIEMEQDEVSKAIEAGTVELKSDDLTIYTNDDFNTFKINLSNDEYKKGKAAGVEMTVKEAREKHGLEFEGKSIDNLIDALKTKTLAEAKVEPSKKIQELTTDLEKVRGNYNALQGEFDQFKTGISEKETRTKKDNDLLSFIPNDGLKVDRDITLLALKNKIGLDIDYTEDGAKAVTINGVIQKDDKTMSPISPKDFITAKLTELGLTTKKEGGRGGEDEFKGGANSYDGFVERMSANNIPEGSIEFSENLQKEIAAKTVVM